MLINYPPQPDPYQYTEASTLLASSLITANEKLTIITHQHDSSAEWNIYWDPKSSNELFAMNLPIICIPLDVTNKVPVTKKFLAKLAKQSKFRLSNLAGPLWALPIDTIPNYCYTYFMWDILATSYLAMPEEFTVEKVKVSVSVRPPNAGQTHN